MNRITVGIDGSKNSHAALEWALEEAQLRGIGLHLVSSWTAPVVTEGFGMGEIYEACMTAAKALVDNATASIADRIDGTVTHTIENGSAADLLIREGIDSTMLVVGARGHGGFAGLVLGSVASQVSHHAPCPVVIVPASA